jgi:hypothetical protein
MNRCARGAASVYKGVTRTSDKRKWQVYIKAAGHMYLGSFAEETQAARVYDAAARKYFGEFARLNFPRSREQSSMGLKENVDERENAHGKI